MNGADLIAQVFTMKPGYLKNGPMADQNYYGNLPKWVMVILKQQLQMTLYM